MGQARPNLNTIRLNPNLFLSIVPAIALSLFSTTTNNGGSRPLTTKFLSFGPSQGRGHSHCNGGILIAFVIGIGVLKDRIFEYGLSWYFLIWGLEIVLKCIHLWVFGFQVYGCVSTNLSVLCVPCVFFVTRGKSLHAYMDRIVPHFEFNLKISPTTEIFGIRF